MKRHRKIKEKSNARLVIFGSGSLRDVLQAQIESLNMEGTIVLAGHTDCPIAQMRRACAFVLSSRFEGFGLVVAEAMACECYVVATDSGGVAEVMGDTGKRVPINDSMALANAIKEAIELNVVDRIQNNKKARMRVEEYFSLEASVQTWLALYEA